MCALQVLHCLSCIHQVSHLSVPASSGVAEINDAEATTTARTITEEKCIMSDDVIWDEIYLKG